MSKLSKALAVSLAAAATMGLSSSANALYYDIDLFDTPVSYSVVTDQTGSLNGSDGGIFVEQGSYANVLGGWRDLNINKLDTSTNSDGPATLGVYGGALQWENGPGVRSIATVQWDGNDTSSSIAGRGLDTGSGGFNLLNACGGTNSCVNLTAILDFADLGFNYSFTIYKDAANWSRITTGSVGNVDDDPDAVYPAPYTSNYSLSWFLLSDGFYFIDGLPFTVSHLGSGADLNDVGAMEFEMWNDGTCYKLGGTGTGTCKAAADVTITSLRAVPEPGSMALVGLGLVGLAGLRRRKAA